MKRYTIIIWITSLFLLSGCYDLDRAPFDQLSSSTFWQTEDQCKQGLMGVYASLKEDDLYGKLFLIDVNSDLASGYDQYESLQLGTATPRTDYMNGKWQNAYNTIQRANLAIRSISEAEIDEAVKKQMVGEAHFLRALVYFHLLDYFGGVPLYDETTDLEKEFNNLMKLRGTENETREFILKDLDKALQAGLPAIWSKDNYGRVTQSAVHALTGKVHLYNKEYKAAISSLNEALKPEYGHSLHPDYAGLFTPAGNGSPEMIFGVINQGGTGQEYGMPMAWYAGSRGSFKGGWNNTVPSTQLVDMYEYKDGKPFNWDELFPGYTTDNAIKEKVMRAMVNDGGTTVLQIPEGAEKVKTMYAQRDSRLNATVIAPYSTFPGWVSDSPKALTFIFGKKEDGGILALNEKNGFMRNNRGGWETYFWRKFVPEGNWSGAITDRAHTPVNFPVIRLADVYLMLAEAYNEEGQPAKAVEYINKVRARVKMALINSGPTWLTANTREEVFMRVFRERAFELANEGIRDSDLRRWKISHKILNKVDYGITGKPLLTRKFNENRDYLWPIPAAEIEINKGLKQNPGW